MTHKNKIKCFLTAKASFWEGRRGKRTLNCVPRHHGACSVLFFLIANIWLFFQDVTNIIANSADSRTRSTQVEISLSSCALPALFLTQ